MMENLQLNPVITTYWMLYWTLPDGRPLLTVGEKGVTMLLDGEQKAFVPDGWEEAWRKQVKSTGYEPQEGGTE